MNFSTVVMGKNLKDMVSMFYEDQIHKLCGRKFCQKAIGKERTLTFLLRVTKKVGRRV